MNKLIRNKQAGFTLIEIAIVLIIIGLLLGGVLKGQTMVKNAKIKRLAADSQGLASATHAYVDSYWALPGDDQAATRWATTGGNGGGTIGQGVVNATWSARNIFIPTHYQAETLLAINHLRCAELLKGNCVGVPITTANVSTVGLMKNAVGGIIGLDDSSGIELDMLASTGVTGLTGKMVCQSNVDQSYASIYDTQFDDGVGTTGSIRGSAKNATVYTDATVAAIYDSTDTVFVCSSF